MNVRDPAAPTVVTTSQRDPDFDDRQGSAPECEELLPLAHPQLYRKNLFRVLGIPVSATSADVRRRQNLLDMQKKLGMAPAAAGTGPLALDPPATEEETAAALDRLNDPTCRVLDELFWFWPAASQDKKISGPPDAGLIALEQGQFKQATELWLAETRTGSPAPVAAHNLAVLCHLSALDDETKWAAGTLDAKTRERVAEKWTLAFSRWNEVLESEDFWTRVKDRVRQLKDDRLTTGFARRVRGTLPKALLLINVRLAYDAAERRDAEGAARHVRLIRDAKFAGTTCEEVLRDGLKPTRDRLKTTIESARYQWKSDPARGNTAVREMYRLSGSLLTVVGGVLAVDDPVRVGLHDTLADAMLEGQGFFVRKTEDWQEGVRLLQLATSIAGGASQKEKLAEQIKVLKEWDALGNDWCSPGYWQLPEEYLNALEEIRKAVVEARDYDAAIRALAGMNPIIGRPLRRCLAYALSQKAVLEYNAAQDVYNDRPGILSALWETLKASGDPQRAAMLLMLNRPTPETPNTEMPPCPCCTSRFYTRWVNFTYRGASLFLCAGCSNRDDREKVDARAALAAAISGPLECMALAEELDPDDAGVKRNAKVLKDSATDLGMPPPSTKAIKARLGTDTRRGRRTTLKATQRDIMCHFCGGFSPEASCAITVPMSGESATVQFLFHQGTEFRFTDVIIPRCRRCRDEHESVPGRQAPWEQARAAAAEESRFPAILAQIAMTQARLAAAKIARQTAGDPKNCIDLTAQETAARQAADTALQRVEIARQLVVEALKAVDDAGQIGNRCERCKRGLKNDLCPSCDPLPTKMTPVGKLIIGLSMSIAFLMVTLIVAGHPLYAPCLSAAAGVVAFAFVKRHQLKLRKALAGELAEHNRLLRPTAVAEAAAQLRNAEVAVATEEQALQIAIEAAKLMAGKLRVAQNMASGLADQKIAMREAELAEARRRLAAAQKQAVVDYEKQVPRPCLSPGVMPEEKFIQFYAINTLRGRGWKFGADGKDTAKPVNVKGLVADNGDRR